MDNFVEKEAIYEQMKLLLEERREITKSYYDLKQRLEKLKENAENNIENSPPKKRFSKEIEVQKYFAGKTGIKHSNCYHDIALKIASCLKECDTPIATHKLYKVLKEKYNLNISYNNLTSNILPRIQNDSAINVERAYRGYWQYKLK